MRERERESEREREVEMLEKKENYDIVEPELGVRLSEELTLLIQGVEPAIHSFIDSFFHEFIHSSKLLFVYLCSINQLFFIHPSLFIYPIFHTYSSFIHSFFVHPCIIPHPVVHSWQHNYIYGECSFFDIRDKAVQV